MINRGHIFSLIIFILALIVGLASVSTDYKTFIPEEERICAH
jgi:hypothetical protein